MANSPRNSVGNVRSDMDITYPEHLSRLHRHSVLADFSKCYYNPKKNARSRRGNRYRTQPVTFDEIQEVDEENMLIDNQNTDDQTMSASSSTSKLDLDFKLFTQALGAKMKSQAVENLASDATQDVKQSNGIQPAKPEDQRRWKEYTREGSV